MAWVKADVEKWLGLAADSLPAAELQRVCDAVQLHAARHYDLTAPTADHDQALIMAAAKLWQRRHSPDGFSGSDDRGPIRVHTFDADVQRLLADRLTTAGLFGASGNTIDAEA